MSLKKWMMAISSFPSGASPRKGRRYHEDLGLLWQDSCPQARLTVRTGEGILVRPEQRLSGGGTLAVHRFIEKSIP